MWLSAFYMQSIKIHSKVLKEIAFKRIVTITKNDLATKEIFIIAHFFFYY